MEADPAVLYSDKIQMKLMKGDAAWERRTALYFLEELLYVSGKELIFFKEQCCIAFTISLYTLVLINYN